MRKLFTRLISIFMLISALGLNVFAQGPVLVPEDDATNVEPTLTEFSITFVDDFDIAFSENGGTLSIFDITDGGSQIIKTIPIEEGATGVSIVDGVDGTDDGDMLVIEHAIAGGLVEGVEYQLLLTANAIDGYGSIDAGDWTFEIGDYTAPALDMATLVPEAGETGVDIGEIGDVDFALEFAFEDNDSVTVVTGNIIIYKEDGTVIDIIAVDSDDVEVSPDGNQVTVTLDDDAYFEEYTTYYVNIEAGAFEDISENANPFAGLLDETTWTFTTRDYSAPEITDADVVDVDHESGTLNVTISEDGSVWYAVELASAGEPTFDADYTEVEAVDNAISVALTGLIDSKDYIVYVVAENLEGDVSDNPVEVEFTTDDATAPLLTDNSEVSTATNPTTGLEMVFNEEVEAGTGNLVVYIFDTNVAVRTIAAADLDYAYDADDDETTVTATFAALTADVQYYVLTPDGLVKDMSGNDWVSVFTAKTDWDFYGADDIAPEIEITAEDWDEVAAKITTSGSDIYIDFTENVEPANGDDWGSVDWEDYIAVELDNVKIDIDDVDYYDAGDHLPGSPARIVIELDESLDPNEEYMVIVRPGTITDKNGNEIPVGHTQGHFPVNTGDFGALTITYNPADGGNTDDADVNPTITFSKGVYFDGGAVTVASLEANIAFDVDFTVTWDAGTRTATIIPDEPLESETSYTVDFTGSAYEDVYEDTYPDGSATFDVNDIIAPTVELSHEGTITDPDADDDDLEIVLDDTNDLYTVEFGTEITDSSDGSGDGLGAADALVTFKKDGPDGENLDVDDIYFSGTTIVIDPTADLVAGQTYYYGIGASVEDENGNVNEATYGTFTFAPVLPDELEVIAYYPDTMAIGVELDAGELVATLQFDENVKYFAEDTVALFASDASTVIDEYIVTPGDFVNDVLTMTFDDGALDLGSQDTFYIAVPADFIANSDNTKLFAGIAPGEWMFISKDTLAPEIAEVIPNDGTSDVELDALLKIAFSEPVNPGTGDIVITRLDGAPAPPAPAGAAADVVHQTIDASVAANFVFNGTRDTVTILHTAFDYYNTYYQIEVPATAFADDADNDLDAGITAGDWIIQTVENIEDTLALVADPFTPEDDADMVALDAVFQVEFNKPIKKSGVGGIDVFLMKYVDATGSMVEGEVTANNDVLIETLAISDAAVTVDGNVATFDFDADLDADTHYYIFLEDSAFMDIVNPDGPNPDGQSTYSHVIDNPETWDFFTTNVYVPEYEIAFTERGTGLMDITSDITITFNKAIEEYSGTAITNANIPTLFDLVITGGDDDGDTIAFTGEINAGKTEITLYNASFEPALTEDIEYLTLSTKENAIRGDGSEEDDEVDIDYQIDISDYVAPDIMTLQANGGAPLTSGDEVDMYVAAIDLAQGGNTPVGMGTIYYIYGEDTAMVAAATVKSEAVAADQLFENVTSKDFTIDGLTSETMYAVFAVAEDEVGNLGEVERELFTTADVTKPTVVTKSTHFDANGNLFIVFDEPVDPQNAPVRIINKATGEINGYVELQTSIYGGGGVNDTLWIEAIAGMGGDHNDDGDDYDFEVPVGDTAQEFIIEIDGDIVTDDTSVNNTNYWDGQYGINGNAWVVSTIDETDPVYLSIDPDTGDSPIALDANFTLTFNEDIQLADTDSLFLIQFRNYDVADATAPAPAGAAEFSGEWQDWELLTSDEITVAGNTITIDPSRLFRSSVSLDDEDEGDLWELRVLLFDGVVSDMAGNVWVEGDTEGDFDVCVVEQIYHTVDLRTPVLAYSDPEDGDDDVSIETTTVEFYFDEYLYMLDGSEIDRFDIDSIAFMKKDGVEVPFVVEDYGFDGDGDDDAIYYFVLSFVDEDGDELEDLDYGTTYSFGVRGLFMDEAGNAIPETEVSFTTETLTPEDLHVWFIPDNNDDEEATPIEVDGVFRVAFDGQIYTYQEDPEDNNLTPDSAYLVQTFRLWDDTNDEFVDFVPAIELWTADSTVVTITPVDPLDSEAYYELMLLENMLQLGQGNVLPLGDGFAPLAPAPAPPFSVYAENDYLAEDVDAPYVQDMDPNNGGDVAKTGELLLDFNEDVQAGTGTIEIRTWAGVLVAEIDASTLENDDDDEIIVADLSEFTLSTDPTDRNNEYYVIIPEGAITDMSGNPFEGILEVDEWLFYVLDDNIPAETDLFPAHESTNVSVGTDLEITFDRSIYEGEYGHIALYKADGTGEQLFRTEDEDEFGDMVVISGDRRTVTIDLEQLEVNTTYNVEVLSGTFESENGIEHPGIVRTSWSFTTEINDIPTLVSLSPEIDEEGVELNAQAVLTFDVDVQAGTGVISLHNADGTLIHSFDVATEVVFDGVTATIDLDGYVEPNTDYYIIIGDAGVITNTSTEAEGYDPDEDDLDEPNVWAFSTSSNVPPTLDTYTPNAETTLTDNHPTFVMTFSEDVVLGTGYVYVYAEGETETPILTIDIADAVVDGAVVTLDYVYDEVAGGLDKDANYYVLFDEGIVTDGTYPVAELTDVATWTFTTGPDFATPVDPTEELVYTLYPNPVSDILNISNADKLERVMITNIAGQTVKVVTNNLNQIDTNELRTGYYFVTLYSNEGVVKTERIVKR